MYAVPARVSPSGATGKEVQDCQFFAALERAAGPELYAEMLRASRAAYAGVEDVVLMVTKDITKDFLMVPIKVIERQILQAVEPVSTVPSLTATTNHNPSHLPPTDAHHLVARAW